MIIDLILGWFQDCLTWFASLLPSGQSLADGTNGLAAALSHTADLNYYLPIAEVFTFTVGVMMVFPALMGVTLTLWVVALIRGGSARA